MLFGPKSDDDKRVAVDAAYTATAKKFRDVPNMPVEEAQQRLREGSIVLVDVRSPEEQAVSMVAGAVTAQDFDERQDDFTGKTVVTYCTVGYRSGMLARSLKESGWEAYNLHGAILGWVHAGGDLVDANGPTKRVHIYSRRLNLLPEGFEAVW